MHDIALSETAKNLKLGKYRHYKGDVAEVLAVALHSETHEELVVYTHPNKDGVILTWVRPLAMFLDVVQVEGVGQPRFEYIG